MPPLTPSQRKAAQRERQAAWLQKNARGLTAEALVSKLMTGEARLTWVTLRKMQKGMKS
jgi:hypothetical protein